MALQLLTCQHLQPLERALREAGIPIEAEDWWDKKEGKWLYFRCTLAEFQLRNKFNLPDFVEYHSYDGRVGGHEAGFVCSQCQSCVSGGHPDYAGSRYPFFA